MNNDRDLEKVETSNADGFVGTLRRALARQRDVSAWSADDIARRHKELAAEAQRKQTELAARATEANRIEAEHQATLAEMRAELARALEVDLEFAEGKLRALRDAEIIDTKPLWTQLVRVFDIRSWEWHEVLRPNVDVARDARHALAGMGRLPKVGGREKAFGTEARIRALPPLDHQAIKDGPAYIAGPGGRVAGLFGIRVPTVAAPEVESPAHARVRLANDLVDADRAFALREIELVTENYQKARLSAERDHRRALGEVHVSIVKTIDATLAALPMGEAWFWARQLRRRVSLVERRFGTLADNHISDFSIEHIFTRARACGARFAK